MNSDGRLMPGASQPGRRLYQESIQGENGYVDLPTAPGLGIELDEELMKKNDMYGHDWRNQESYDPDDSSVVDW